MTAGGWLLLILSCTAISAWVVICYVRILQAPHPSEEMHAPLDIDTRDTDWPAHGRASHRPSRPEGSDGSRPSSS